MSDFPANDPYETPEHWSREEVDYLTAAWGIQTAAEIAHFLGRGRGAVCGKARRCGLKRLKPSKLRLVKT